MVTQAQIARKLGVSRQLVTFALADYPQVSKQSKERIRAAALEMGYQPNPHAKALKSQKTGIIALWIPDQISTHYSHVTQELSRLLKAAGHELIISEIGANNTKQIWSHVPVDGIVAVDAASVVQTGITALAAKSVPLVSIGAYCGMGADQVRVDFESGTQEIMEHLIGSGFRRIAHATFVRKDLAHESRRVGYLRAMQQAQLETEFIYYPLSERLRPAVRQIIQEYVRKQGCPDAIFCHSDDAALGIYRGLCDAGISVPDQVALVGVDGIEDTEYLEHPLTTLVQPVREMCEAAWKFLQVRLNNPNCPPQQILLRPKLDIRESTSRRS